MIKEDASGGGGAKQYYVPRRKMVFTWQAPLMFMSYSVCAFLAGLTVLVGVPIVRGERKGTWGDEGWNVRMLQLLFFFFFYQMYFLSNEEGEEKKVESSMLILMCEGNRSRSCTLRRLGLGLRRLCIARFGYITMCMLSMMGLSATSIARWGLGVCLLLGMIEVFLVIVGIGMFFFSCAVGISGDGSMQVQRMVLHVLSNLFVFR